MPRLEERNSILYRQDNDWICFFVSGKDTGQGASWPKNEPPFRGREVGLAIHPLGKIWARSGQDLGKISGQDIWARRFSSRQVLAGQIDLGKIWARSGQDLGKISGQGDSQADKCWQGK